MKRIIKFILICLGFKSLTACDIFYGTDEYGTPYAGYEIKGRVSDKEGAPIPGIRVGVSSDSVTVTDTDGCFHSMYQTFPPDDNTIEINFKDIDGEAGGGFFEEQTVTAYAEMTGEGEGWNRGSYKVDINVTMNRKDTASE